MSDTRPGAQMRLRYESINSTNGAWVPQDGPWHEATPSLLMSWQKRVTSEGFRADRRNWRIELRHFDIETFTVSPNSSWSEIQTWIDNPNVSDVPAPTYVVISGNPADGFGLTGPFNWADAEAYSQQLDGDWWVVKVVQP